MCVPWISNSQSTYLSYPSPSINTVGTTFVGKPTTVVGRVLISVGFVIAIVGLVVSVYSLFAGEESDMSIDKRYEDRCSCTYTPVTQSIATNACEPARTAQQHHLHTRNDHHRLG